MKVFSIRCAANDFSYCIISGTQDAPALDEIRSISFPKGYEEAESLLWLYQEISDILKKCSPDFVVLKAPEAMARRTRSLDRRLHNEGIVMFAAVNCGIKGVRKKVNQTIAKDLGFKGKSKYLKEMDTKPIENYGTYNTNEKDSINAGWSCLIK